MSALPTSALAPPGPSSAGPPPPAAFKCPVCGARFRESTTCSRCRSDLTLLMRIAARAWVARQRCRDALSRGDLHAALRWAGLADRLQTRR